jgi:hypothetical protein
VFWGPFGVSVATSQCCNSFLSWSLRMFGGTCGCAYRSSSTAIIPLLCLGIRSRCCSFTVCPWSRDHFRSPRVMFPVVRTLPRMRCLVSISKSFDASIHFHTSPIIRAASLALYKLPYLPLPFASTSPRFAPSILILVLPIQLSTLLVCVA